MKKGFLPFVIFLGIFLCSMAPAFGATITVDEDRLKEIIKEVIKENPALLYETLAVYAREQRTRVLDQQLDACFKNRVTDSVSDANPSKGPVHAPITIIEYTDFECPYCARGANTIDTLIKQYAGNLRLVFKNNPLKIHAQAIPAAKAALAAGNQGKFWQYHNLLFANNKELGEQLYLKLARDLKLDLARFNNDRKSPEIAQQITIDMEQAQKLGFNSAPVFILNGVVVRGSLPLDYFVRVVDRLLKEKKNN